MSSTQAIVDVLGGKRALGHYPESTADFRHLVLEGIPFAAVQAVAETYGLTQEALAGLLGASQRNLARRRSGRLTAEESDRLYRFARVLAHAVEIFEAPTRVSEWLRAPNRALGKATPLQLLDTDIGVQQVDDVLGRIEHGIVQ